MKLRLCLFLMVCFTFLSNGQASVNVFNIKGRVIDKAGRGISGVVVNNGTAFTRTDANGNWALRTDTFVSKFISISTPAAYKLPSKNSIASGFYMPVRQAVNSKSCNFVLEKRAKQSNEFYYIAISDPQMLNASDMKRWNTEFVPDMRSVVDSLSKTRDVVGITVGDMVFDNMPFLRNYASSFKNMKITMFQCIGNHDFDKRYKGLNNERMGTGAYGEMVYGSLFGPVDYSFNIGKAHVITMKNINYKGNKTYVEYMTENQLRWLANDLKFVPKGSLVILNMHAAGWNKDDPAQNMRGVAALQKLLAGYKVHVFCGHTHYFQNVAVNASLYQHNIGAACGAWWNGWLNRCGTPNGYLVVDVSGTNVDWQYKSTGFPFSYQMTLYDKGEFGTQPGYVVANIWDTDAASKVEWYQDNKLMGTMQRFTGVDFDFGSRLIPFGRPANTSHLFRCKPVGTYKEIKIVATNPSGRKMTGVIRPHVSVIAHRGGAGLYPENTIEAMLNAVKLGVTDIEMDLHVTKDGVVVVSHDPYVIGYGKKYPIYSLTWKQLTSKVIGNAKDPAFPDSKRLYTHVPMITTLIDSVETYCHLHRLPPVRYTIEIKSDPSADGKLTPDYKTFTDQCIKALGSRNLGARLLLQSFDVRTLKYVHSKYPSARLLYLIDSTSGTYDKAMAALGFVPYAIGPDYTMVNSAFVSKAKSAGMRVIPYTVDTKADAQKMVKAGVNAIITNYPDKMFGWIK